MNYEFSKIVYDRGLRGWIEAHKMEANFAWKHGRAKACHSKYSPQEEDRKHGFINRRSRTIRI